MNKNLVVFYSHSGNTRTCAQLIAKHAEADVLELVPATPYPADLWETVDVFKEESSTGQYPDIHAYDIDVASYENIFIGSPNWGNTVASPLVTFFKQCDLTGKNIMPFLTHGGGGKGQMVHDISAYAKGHMQPAYVFAGANVNEKKLIQWLEDVLTT